MGRGSSGGAGDLPRGGGGGNDNPISTQDMISARNAENQAQVDDVLKVARAMTNKYGKDVAIEGNFQVAKMPAGSNTLGYYDSDGNIAINSNYMKRGMNDSYDKCVKSGYHPPRGRKSGMEAVAAHEYGHSLSANAARKAGYKDLDQASEAIVKQARKTTKHRTDKSFAGKISGYAKTNYAECVAEAVADVHCNGKRAKAESHAVVNVLNSMLKGKKKK